MLNVKCNQSTMNLYKLLINDLPKYIDGLPRFNQELITKMNDFPYADIELLKSWFEIEAIDKHLRNINLELNTGNTAAISRTDWINMVCKHKELFTSFQNKYSPNHSTKHWHWGDRTEWKNNKIGETDKRSGEKFTEVFADRAMSNFELWLEFGKCPKCKSRNIEKDDGGNQVGICIDCNASHEYNKDHRYYNDIPSVLRPKENTAYSRAVEYANKFGWL